MTMTSSAPVRLPRPLQPIRLDREEVLAFAEAHDLEVGDRGPIPEEVRQAFVDHKLDYRRRAQKRLQTQGRA